MLHLGRRRKERAKVATSEMTVSTLTINLRVLTLKRGELIRFLHDDLRNSDRFQGTL